MEDVVHHCLEGGGGVCEAEDHYRQLKEAAISAEHCFFFIALLDPNIVILPTDVQLGEVFCAMELVDERKRIAILNRHLIQFPIVLDRMEGAILLLDEEE